MAGFVITHEMYEDLRRFHVMDLQFHYCPMKVRSEYKWYCTIRASAGVPESVFNGPIAMTQQGAYDKIMGIVRDWLEG